MMNDSLFTLADQFVAYKRQNGRVYQTGAYYLEKYIQFASETNPEITAPDRKSVEGFLEKYEDAPGGLYNAAAFLREFSRYLIARGYPHFYGNVTASGMIRITKAAIWYSLLCFGSYTAVASAVKKPVCLPERMCI